MNESELRDLVWVLVRKLKEMHHRTLVYQAGIQFARDYGVSSIDEVLRSAEDSPQILQENERQFAALQAVIELSPGDDLEEAVRKWLEDVTPPGKPN